VALRRLETFRIVWQNFRTDVYFGGWRSRFLDTSIILTEFLRLATEETAGDVTARGTVCGVCGDGKTSTGEMKNEQQTNVKTLLV
jgi:hypothetical protein